MPRASRLVAAAFAMVAASPASALCTYHGADNAHTTIAQEFADARWVVRARVVAATDGEVRGRGPNAGTRWTGYRLRVLQAYKGAPPRRFSMFTDRNSGGFYLERPNLPLPAAHDIGGDYLLFLLPVPAHVTYLPPTRLATMVNYNCGQSGPWRDVPAASRRLLMVLRRR